jgi:hypothetical protein
MKNFFFALLIFAAGCGSTTSIVNSWKAPGETLSPEKYKKGVIVVMAKDENVRKLAEDQIAADHKLLNVSYPLFTMKQLGEDTLKIKNKLKEQGFDAAIVMKLITVKAKSTFAQGGHNQAYTQNGIYYYPDYLNAGAYVTDMDYILATNVYSLRDEKLLWTGVTESTNPKKIDKLINQVAKEVVFKMREDKLIAE